MRPGSRCAAVRAGARRRAWRSPSCYQWSCPAAAGPNPGASLSRYFLAAAALLTAAPAAAQYTNSYGYTFNNPISASINSMMWSRLNDRLLYKSMLKKQGYGDAQLDAMSTSELEAALTGGAKKATGEAKKPAPPAAARFKPAKKRLLLTSLAAALTKDPAQQRALVEVFEAGLKAYEAEASKDGLANDLGGATAFFLGVAWFVFHDGQEPDSDGLTRVARQLQLLFDTPEVRKVADADKQRFYELLVGMGTWLGAAWQQASADGDEATKAQLKEAAAAVLQGYLKVEPSKIRITSAGLELDK